MNDHFMNEKNMQLTEKQTFFVLFLQEICTLHSHVVWSKKCNN